ncbi:MAG: phage integrase N-terminal SAM-like domain-containing protein [Candidatus Marinimicrobia bacterium]|nr:phage integrase N-terminal SAM-like domain-containing protein [Candidatus Neomarinimicrobiota bacterium]
MNLPELFRLYLESEKFHPATVKNYLVDLNHFLNWLATKTGVKFQVAGKAIFGLLTQETVKEYKTVLVQQKISQATINRRLSTLRKFAQFGQVHGWLTENPVALVSNLPSSQPSIREKVLTDFQKQLEKEKVSRLTIKNYLSDLRHFLNWLELAT